MQNDLLNMSVTLTYASVLELHIPLGLILLALLRSKRSSDK